MTKRDGALAFGRPDPAQDRLQPNAVLVGRPDFDRFAWVSLGFLGNGLLQLFLSASRSSGVAACGWRGRGFCTDQSIAFRASQPRCGATRASPSSEAIQVATFGLVHNPPSGGGSSRRALSFSSRSGLWRGSSRSGAGDRPEPVDPGRYSGPANAPPSVAQTTSWPTPPRSRAPWPEARSSESAALRSHPCTTGTAAPEPKRSDDPPHAPWFVSPTHGASAYLRPHSQRIPCRPHPPESV
jgi:hypothetical protein